MKQWKRFFTVGAVALSLLLVAQATPAAAVPAIDGIFSLGEWDGAFIQAFDPNEAGITNTYDIKEIRFTNDPTGVYFLLVGYDSVTMVDQDPLSLIRASVDVNLDYNGNGSFANGVDRKYFHTALADGTGQTFKVFDGTGAELFSGTEGTHFKEDVVIEYFIPAASGGDTLPSTVKGFVSYDNGGGDADDRLPDAMFFTPIPEPTSMSLLGLGILGLFGGAVRRRL